MPTDHPAGETYDLAVIGGGSAGYAAARTAVSEGLRTAVVEGGREVGGLCILRGCMPSKTLIESANRLLSMKDAAEFGLRCESPRAILPEVIARKRRLIGEFADYREGQLRDGRFDFVRGFARFTGPDTVTIRPMDGSPEFTLHARSFVITTGSTHAVPPVSGLAETGFLTSDDILEAESLPDSLIVLGAGPVALEMAHYAAAVGVRVTIIQRSPHFLSGVDTDVSKVVKDSFSRRGMKIFTGTKIENVYRGQDGQCRVSFSHEGKTKEVAAEAVFNGLGRIPATDQLGLSAAGVKLDGRTIVTAPTQQTSSSHIFAAGDVCGPFEVVHIAITQGEIAARNAARLLRGEPASEEADCRLFLFAVFTEPQVAVVGLGEDQAHERGLDVITASYPFGDHGKSLVMAEEHGMVKLIADRATRKILGGSAVGPHASELIHEIVVAMAFHSTADQLAKIPHYHPTLSEIWTYPAEELAEC
ncbi:MAG: dihydrolipoyl dehydrogenase [Terrimicrobiaceae bacterium]